MGLAMEMESDDSVTGTLYPLGHRIQALKSDSACGDRCTVTRGTSRHRHGLA
jgi:hypothetical protein